MNQPADNLHISIQNILYPEVTVRYIDKNTALVYHLSSRIEFKKYGNMYQVMLFFWELFVEKELEKPSIIVFDHLGKIQCNGLFSFTEINQQFITYEKHTKIIHLIVNEAPPALITHRIVIENNTYAGNFEPKIISTKPGPIDWFAYFSNMSLHMLYATCKEVLSGLHGVDINTYSQHSFIVAIHSIQMQSYTWRYCIRSLENIK